jgi:hypothetical protein
MICFQASGIENKKWWMNATIDVLSEGKCIFFKELSHSAHVLSRRLEDATV